MDLKQLRCFVAVAENLHFGQAAQKMNVLPSTLGRQIRLLEEDLGARLFTRSTRHVTLTPAGQSLRQDAGAILRLVAVAERSARELSRSTKRSLRIGAIDSAAAGLLPTLLGEFRQRHPDVDAQLMECSSAQQVQFLLSGRLDVAFVRPPIREIGLSYEFLLYETLVVALPEHNPLADKGEINIDDLAGVPLIVPPRQSRPHSYKVVMRAFEAAGLEANIALEASEKQTIINLVAAGIGIALVPDWVARMKVSGVIYRPLRLGHALEYSECALGVVWSSDLRNQIRDTFLSLVRESTERSRIIPPMHEKP